MTTDILKVCVDRRLPPIAGPAPQTREARLAADRNKLWPPHQRTLHVRFLDGDDRVQEKVATFAQEWCKYANVTLVFDDAPDAVLRVSFTPGGSWSFIGTDALDPRIGPNDPTINLGWLTPATPNDEVSQVVLHEFGHALGLIHEHQNPAGRIPWNREAVYAFYAGPPNFWSREEVDVNIFQVYDSTVTNYSQFDPQSIMLYPIPPQFTDGVFQVGWNKVLSPMDRQFIGVIYPLDHAPPPGQLVVDGPPVDATLVTPGEIHRYTLVIDQAGRYLLETEGSTDVTLELLDLEGQRLAHDDDSGWLLNARLEQPLSPGTYQVHVRHFSETGTGPYRLRVRRL